ncbi:unnamed protein product [Arabis nemorensis]|uniref:Uncharacterized protein n=1 Tax=Arabis nemorensis TaxID=586526 RepID=A0A565CC54_9BRAS|nr:unnamed protein product [Arabis nemorensis]
MRDAIRPGNKEEKTKQQGKLVTMDNSRPERGELNAATASVPGDHLYHLFTTLPIQDKKNNVVTVVEHPFENSKGLGTYIFGAQKNNAIESDGGAQSCGSRNTRSWTRKKRNVVGQSIDKEEGVKIDPINEKSWVSKRKTTVIAEPSSKVSKT